MSGSNTSAPGSAASSPEPLSFTVHSQPDPRALGEPQQRAGRLRMLLVLAVCAAPVIASYFTFYVIKPKGSAYGELITPTVQLPANLPLTDLQGQRVAAELRRAAGQYP